jgi:hypothetical protein
MPFFIERSVSFNSENTKTKQTNNTTDSKAQNKNKQKSRHTDEEELKEHRITKTRAS